LTVTIITSDRCQPCAMTKRALTKNGVEYTERNVQADPEALEIARELGYQATPVVLVQRDGEALEHWSGLRVEKIKALITAA
jgi:glutaredoxin-like protein NrdH